MVWTDCWVNGTPGTCSKPSHEQPTILGIELIRCLANYTVTELTIICRGGFMSRVGGTCECR